MVVAVTTGLTVADIERLPEDGVVRHLIDGELFEMTPPMIRHQRVVARVLLQLAGHADATGGLALPTPTGVRLSERDMPEPDVLFVSAAHMDRVGERYIEGPPDLVVEVSSPSTRRLDLVRKRRQYERFAVPEFWFIDLDADRVEVYTLIDGRYGTPILVGHDDTVRATVTEDLAVAVAAILAD
ncbi:Uma2 family endonuclease [soil metagenome]